MLAADSPWGTALTVVCLIAVIGVAVSVRRVPPAAVAVPGALILLLLGVVSWSEARAELSFIGPTIGFLAAMLVVAEICALTGVFSWMGALMARASRGSATTLLGLVFVAAAVTTATLSIDTTIVLLTPVAVLTARRVHARVAPVGTATAHLANTASTLLPISNLTNLLAFSATGLGFLHFAGLMAAPWVASIVVEYLLFRWFFSADLRARSEAPAAQSVTSPAPDVPAPTATLVMLSLLLLGFIVAEPLGVPLAVVATIGAVVMLVPLLRRAPVTTVIRAVRSTNPPFLAFVAALGIIILPIREGPIGEWVSGLVPNNESVLALLLMATIAAVAANVLNNLPATLLLIPMVSHSPALALAMLLGVNIGPNLTYFGSLANLLWREVMHRQTTPPPTRRYMLLGALTVPPTLIVGVLALWMGLQVS